MKVQVINNSGNPLPKYESKYSAGMDIRADFSRVTPENPMKGYGKVEFDFNTNILTIHPGSRVIIPTGLFTAIPEGYEVQLRPRSGLAIKKGLNLINCIGTIDADYRNEWGIPAVNQGFEPIHIEHGERICQAVLNKIEVIDWEETDKLEGHDRGGGLGHTGVK